MGHRHQDRSALSGEKRAIYGELGLDDGKSVDELADYMSYALRILKNVGLQCEGITTPGGFGNGVLPELSQATLQSCRDVFKAEIPHYFRHLFTDEHSVAPRVEYASGLTGPTQSASSRSSAAQATGSAAGTGCRPARPTSISRKTCMADGCRRSSTRASRQSSSATGPAVYFNGEEVGLQHLQGGCRRLTMPGTTT